MNFIMNFIELFKEQFYFIGCDITREIRNHREVKIVTFPKEVLKKVVEQAICENERFSQMRL